MICVEEAELLLSLLLLLVSLLRHMGSWPASFWPELLSPSITSSARVGRGSAAQRTLQSTAPATHLRARPDTHACACACLGPGVWGGPLAQVVLGGGQDASQVTTTAAAAGGFEARFFHKVGTGGGGVGALGFRAPGGLGFRLLRRASSTQGRYGGGESGLWGSGVQGDWGFGLFEVRSFRRVGRQSRAGSWHGPAACHLSQMEAV